VTDRERLTRMTQHRHADACCMRADKTRRSVKFVRRSLAFVSRRLYNRPSLSSAGHRKAINHPGTSSTAPR
jgi:hypothetical protein